MGTHGATVVWQAIELKQLGFLPRSGGHSSSYWCQKGQVPRLVSTSPVITLLRLPPFGSSCPNDPRLNSEESTWEVEARSSAPILISVNKTGLAAHPLLGAFHFGLRTTGRRRGSRIGCAPSLPDRPVCAGCRPSPLRRRRRLRRKSAAYNGPRFRTDRR